MGKGSKTVNDDGNVKADVCGCSISEKTETELSVSKEVRANALLQRIEEKLRKIQV